MKYLYKRSIVTKRAKQNNIISLNQGNKRKKITESQKKQNIIDVDEIISDEEEEALLTGMLIW